MYYIDSLVTFPMTKQNKNVGLVGRRAARKWKTIKQLNYGKIIQQLYFNNGIIIKKLYIFLLILLTHDSNLKIITEKLYGNSDVLFG